MVCLPLLLVLVSPGRAGSSLGLAVPSDRVQSWVVGVAADGEGLPLVERASLTGDAASVEAPGLAAPRVLIAWPLDAAQDRVARVVVELIAGPGGALERRLVFEQEVAIRVDGGPEHIATSGGALVVRVQLRPGVHPGVAEAAVEGALAALLAQDDVLLQAEIDRALAALARDRRLQGAEAASSEPVTVDELRTLASSLGMPGGWRVTTFLPDLDP